MGPGEMIPSTAKGRREEISSGVWVCKTTQTKCLQQVFPVLDDEKIKSHLMYRIRPHSILHGAIFRPNIRKKVLSCKFRPSRVS